MSDKKYDGLCNIKECLNKAELMPVVELRDEEYSEAFSTVLDLSVCIISNDIINFSITHSFLTTQILLFGCNI